MPVWKSLLLGLYYYGSGPVRWWGRRRAASAGRVPATVLFYHRVADDGANDWTISTRTFVRQIRWLQAHFEMISLEEVQRRMRRGASRRPCVSITFDDGYAENCREAIPLLVREGIPCTYFVTLRNVLRGEPFPHDLARKQWFPPNTIEELRAMADEGIEIGAHTYTHPDLGRVTDRRKLHYEVVAAGEELQRLIGQPVRYFAFPYGRYANLSPAAFELAHQAGYEAVCSAYGGYNWPGDDAFHLQRVPGDESTIRLKNWTTVDPRKLAIRRYEYERVTRENDEARMTNDEAMTKPK